MVSVSNVRIQKRLPGEENPFEPTTTGVPIKLTLDAASFVALEGEPEEQAEFLLELCETDAVDALWSWDGTPLTCDIRETRLTEAHNDTRAVTVIGQQGFIGAVRNWSRYERLAAETGARREDREWLLRYLPLAAFHQSSSRHLLVTGNERLLVEAHTSQGFFAKNRYRVVSIAEAIYLLGLLMRSRGEIFFGASRRTNPYTLKAHLAPDVIPSRGRLTGWAHELQGDDPFDSLYANQRGALAQSLLDRVSDLLNGRDNISLQSARRQNNATLDEILYHLRGVVGSAAALFDSIAVIAHLAFGIELRDGAGHAAISLRRQHFRSALRRGGATGLADTAATLAPLMTFVWSLRSPVLHREGISGYIYGEGAAPGRNDASRIALTDEQANALKSVCREQGTEPERWGLDGRRGLGPNVDPESFGNRLVLEVIAAVEELLAATANDLGLPHIAGDWGEEENTVLGVSMKEMIRRFRWLSGLPTRGVIA